MNIFKKKILVYCIEREAHYTNIYTQKTTISKTLKCLVECSKFPRTCLSVIHPSQIAIPFCNWSLGGSGNDRLPCRIAGPETTHVLVVEIM